MSLLASLPASLPVIPESVGQTSSPGANAESEGPMITTDTEFMVHMESDGEDDDIPMAETGALLPPIPYLPPQGKRLPSPKPAEMRGYMYCKCGKLTSPYNVVFCRNINSKTHKCLHPTYHRLCTDAPALGKYGHRPKEDWFCEECRNKGWDVKDPSNDDSEDDDDDDDTPDKDDGSYQQPDKSTSKKDDSNNRDTDHNPPAGTSS